MINAGFSTYDVKELRFFCTEIFGKDKFYWHFKTTNPELIQASITGDMSSIKSNALADYYQELNPSVELNGVYRKSVFNYMSEYFVPLSRDKNNGFINTPFGSYKYRKYWTVKGSNDNPKYECGTEHNYSGGISSSEGNPNMVDTHHTIWFRGKAPSKEEAQKRFLSKMKNKT